MLTVHMWAQYCTPGQEPEKWFGAHSSPPCLGPSNSVYMAMSRKPQQKTGFLSQNKAGTLPCCSQGFRRPSASQGQFHRTCGSDRSARALDGATQGGKEGLKGFLGKMASWRQLPQPTLDSYGHRVESQGLGALQLP